MIPPQSGIIWHGVCLYVDGVIQIMNFSSNVKVPKEKCCMEGKMRRDRRWVAILFLLCFTACSIKFFPSKDEWYAKHFIIMQDFEQKTYKELSTAGKQKFQELFWMVRDPLAEEIFMGRLDYVIENFKKENHNHPWSTDRGKIYLLNGPPAEIRHFESAGGVLVGSGRRRGTPVDSGRQDVSGIFFELWIYPVYPYKIYRVTYQFSFMPPRQWKLDIDMPDSTYIGELERYNREETYGIIDVEGYREHLEALKRIK
jgi:GWxTD domain-containing protein